MPAYTVDSHSSKPPVAGNSSNFPTFFDDKQEEAVIAVNSDDLVDPAAERRYLYHRFAKKKYHLSCCRPRLLQRLDLRIMPMMVLLIMLNFLAGNNIGNARILNSDTGDSIPQSLHMTDPQFRIVLMLFFISCALFETPSTYMLKYFSPPHWLAFLALGWGATGMVIAASHNYGTLLFLRVLLGAFEAGLLPGAIYFLTFWYRFKERAVRVALMLSAYALGGILSGFIAYGVGHLNGALGLEGWRWLFIIEGAPACFLALALFFLLPSYPENASWLSPKDRTLSVIRLKDETSRSTGNAKLTWDGAKATLKDGRLYLHYLAYTADGITLSSLSLFLPTLVNGLGYEGLDAQLFTIPPLALALFVSVAISCAADRYQSRSMLVLVLLVCGGATFFVQAVLPPTCFKVRYAMINLGTMFSYTVSPLLLTWLSGNLRDTDAVTLAIPMNFTFGVLIGQITGIFIYKSSEAPGYPTGHYTNGTVLIVGALCVGILRVIYTKRNMALGIGQSQWIV
ncbi:MFS general substrate transporter [Guyanagaster necrorhizus]|uniref:MFS general substrate transporter n=1 Tax=Guyanagaster necrorhizus TaxID=856835 RepID=A0A9P7VM45_9AGAR|nr:MFS general substrate transporter [Guyanagaster necrorhizus MCA 3950]KAG7442424.1 MFS general substrate transporter [Guyanagaster necrorhizus MCA 3950]